MATSNVVELTPISISIQDCCNKKPTIPVKSKLSLDDNSADTYYSNHNKRGIAVIFNHEVFDDRFLSKRTGTLKDKDDLVKVLTRLEFNVREYNDLNFGDLYAVLQSISKEDHSDNDCLMVCVMSHGEDGKIYARDHCYPTDLLWQLFITCKTLAGKPKMFFIEASRGDEIDNGIYIKSSIEQDSRIGSDQICTIPAMADILVMYSTCRGYVSWRNVTKGSWFIQSLCAELEKNGNKSDLLTLLTSVNRRVVFEYTSNVPDNPHMNRKKQVCTIVSMLTKNMRFSPKTHINKTTETNHKY